MGWSSDVDHTFETLQEFPRLRFEDRIRRTSSDSTHHQATDVVGLEENNHCLLWGQEDVYFAILDAAYLNSSLLCDLSRHSNPPGSLAMSVPIPKQLLSDSHGLLLKDERRELVPSAAALKERIVSRGRSKR